MDPVGIWTRGQRGQHGKGRSLPGNRTCWTGWIKVGCPGGCSGGQRELGGDCFSPKQTWRGLATGNRKPQITRPGPAKTAAVDS